MEAHCWRGKHGSLVGIERGGGIHVGGHSSPINDFVGDTHHGIEVADIALGASSEQARREGKAGGVIGNDLRCGAVTHRVVAG